METFWAVVAGLIPSIGVGLLFWLAMRKIIRADRNERAALDRGSSTGRPVEVIQEDNSSAR